MDAWKEAGLDKKYEATGGLPTEWTWEEYIEASKLMTKTNDDGTIRYGGSDYHSINYFMYSHCQVTGGDMYYEADGTSSYDNPIIKAALERKIKAELEDKIWYPDAKYRGESIQAQTPYCEGITASTIIPNVVRFLHDTEKFNVNWITGFAPFPVVEKGQTNYMSGTPNFSHAGISSYLPEEKFDIAWAWLKWYSTHGVKYLAVAGHQPAWKGTEPGSAVELIYGTKEEAAKWIDIESYNRVVGRSDLPGYVETNLTAYGDVSKALNDPMMQCINGEMTPEACLQQALADAEKALADAE
jgi:multiple sugar transport system substrate-binding protein